MAFIRQVDCLIEQMYNFRHVSNNEHDVSYLTTVYFRITLPKALRRARGSMFNRSNAMPINPTHYGSATYKDYSGEKSSMSYNVGPITAITIAGFLTQNDAFLDAVQALSLGALVHTSWTGDSTKFSGANPTDLNAQRERKWRVDFEDTVNLAPGSFEIPVALVAGQLVVGTDKADLTTAQWVALIAAAEALVKSVDGNPINILGATLVGRNL